MMTRLLVLPFVFFVWQFGVVGHVLAENWPQWRGPHGNGVSSEEGLPSRWSNEENVTWKAPLKGLGLSTPVVWGITSS